MLNPLGSASSRLLSPLGMASKGFTYQQKVLSYSPLAYWPLTETSGTVATSATGSFNGSYVGSPTLASVAGAGATMGSAPLFNANAKYVNVDTVASSITQGAFTIACWIKTITEPAFQNCYGGAYVASAAAANRAQLWYFGALKLFAFSTRSGTSRTSVSNLWAGNNTWFFMAGVYTTANDTLYLNSTAYTPGTAGTTFASGFTACRIALNEDGAQGSANPYYLGHFMIFNSALSGAAIADLATAI